MQKTVLVTGGFGFLGRAVARRFKQAKYRVVGIGRGHWASEEAFVCGFDHWLNAGVTLPGLMTLGEHLDLVVHCAGNGSVGYSLTNPLQDFYKTVQSTVDLLEFLRLSASSALVIYPSSAGVYGAKDDVPIKETDPLCPISPYGYHKKITEDLLASYAQTYGARVAVIRFFSIYGPGLTKQLLWDACIKLRATTSGPATFFGTGEETRDWISSDDAAELVWIVSQTTERVCLVNGASGVRTTVREVLNMLNSALGNRVPFVFNNTVRAGDPRFYHADISRAMNLNWRPVMPLSDGIQQYVRWLNAHQEQGID